MNRVIKSRARGGSLQLTECLASLFALELLSPGQELYVISPWLSDMPVLPNRYGQFRAILPELATVDIGLAAILVMLADRGTHVHVMCRANEERTTDFLRKLGPAVAVRALPELHEKGLVADGFYLRGSMNFTYSGVHINDESVELTTEPEEVARALQEARSLWGEAD